MRNDSISIPQPSKDYGTRIFATQAMRQNLTQLVVLGMVVLLSACANTGTPKKTAKSVDVATQLRADMIADLTSVLPQILEPLNTTIQVSESESGDASEAVPRLSELGYALQRVDADQGKNFLYIIELPGAGDATNADARLRLSIGDIELTRTYRVIRKNTKIESTDNLVWRDGRAAAPVGPLKVAGTRQTLQLTGINVELASNSGDQDYAFSSGRVEFAALAPIEGGIPTISLITEELVQRVTVSTSAGPSLASLNSQGEGFGNLFNGDPSAFASILDNYNRIVREFVIFPNDSQNLGRPGKLMVKKLVSRFSENSDIIGITGCSNGPTSLDIGNEGLALGRASRIAEELVASGVSRDKVFDEGCWSPTTDAPGFPNRGVVIDLWRRAS